MKKILRKILMVLAFALVFALSITMLVACPDDNGGGEIPTGHQLSINMPALGSESGLIAFTVEVFDDFGLILTNEDGSTRYFQSGDRIPANSQVRASWRVMDLHSATLYINNAPVANTTSENHHVWTVNADVAVGIVVEFEGIPTFHTVNFNLQGGQMPAGQHATIQVRDGFSVVRPALNPTNQNPTLHFDNWFTAATGGTLFNFATPITEPVTIFARWIAEGETPYGMHPVVFDLQGGAMPSGQQTLINVTQGTPVARPTQDPVHPSPLLAFDNWFTAEIGGSPFNFENPIMSPTTIFARWTETAPTITVMQNLPTGVLSFTVTYDGNLITPQNNTVSRDGVITIAWEQEPSHRVYVRVNGHRVNPEITNGGTFIVTEHLILTIYVVRQVQISFNLNDGTMLGGIPRNQTIDEGTRIQDPTQRSRNPVVTPRKDEHRFVGWTTTRDDGETIWNFANNANDSKTLFALWAEVGEFDYTFGGDAGEDYVYFHFYVRGLHDDTPSYTIYDLETWGLWVWPDVQGGQGVRYLSVRALGEANHFQSGVVFRVPLTETMTNNGLGFLVHRVDYQGNPLIIGGGQGWVIDIGSRPGVDGGSNRFISSTDIEDNIRTEDGNLHVFLRRGIREAVDFEFDEAFEPNRILTWNRQPNRPNNANPPRPAYFSEGRSWGNITSWDANEFPRMPTATDFALNTGVGYQIMVTTFARSPECDYDPNTDGSINHGEKWGTLRGITYLMTEHDYFCRLGVGVIWLNPITKAGSYHMFDVICYRTVDPRLGGNEAFEDLIEQANLRGIRVIKDFVPNHASWRHPKFLNAISALDSNYRNWFMFRRYNQMQNYNSGLWRNLTFGQPHQGGVGPWNLPGNGPHNHGYRYYSMFDWSMPELNFDYGPVRDYFVDVALYWLGRGLSGLRLDAVKHIYDVDGGYQSEFCWSIANVEGGGQGVHYSRLAGLRGNWVRNRHFWREFNYRIKREFPNAFTIGENFTGNIDHIAPYMDGMDSQFCFHRTMQWSTVYGSRHWFTAGRANQLSNRIQTLQNRKDEGRGDVAIQGQFTSNHDVYSLLNLVALPHAGYNLTYDSALHHTARNRAHVVGSVHLTMPGITWVYYGDELGMSGPRPQNPNYVYVPSAGYVPAHANQHTDRWLRRPFLHTRGGCPTRGVEFRFHGGDRDGNEHIDHWDLTLSTPHTNFNRQLAGFLEQCGDENSTLERFRLFGYVSNNHPVMTRGRFAPMHNATGNVLTFSMTYRGVTYHIFHNLSGTALLSNTWRAGTTSSHVIAECVNSNFASGVLAAYGSIILSTVEPGTHPLVPLPRTWN